MEPWIAPSILAADFAALGQEVDDVTAAGANAIHVDVMDNHFVPNLSVGPLVLESLRRRGTRAVMDVHLMTRSVDRLADQFVTAGADCVSFHPAASGDPARSLALIREGGAKAGLVLSLETSCTVLEPLLEALDFVLVMAVKPGFGGQTFQPFALEQLRVARRLIDASGRAIRLGVDGGVNKDTIAATADAGADTFVAGSAIFGAPAKGPRRVDDYRAAIGELRRAIG